MLRQYASQLRLELKPSRIYKQIVYICCLLCLLAILISNINILLIKAALLVLLAYVTVRALQNNQQRELFWKPDGSWLITHNNNQLEVELLSGSVVTSFFAILNFKHKKTKCIHVLLFKDNIDKQMFRKLRVKVKVEGTELQSHDTLLP